MLKKSFILGVLVSLSGFVFGDAPTTAEGILKDLGISKEEAVAIGLWSEIDLALQRRKNLRAQYGRSYVDGIGRDRMQRWNYEKADEMWEKEYHEKIFPALINEVTRKTLQAALVDIQKQLKEQEQRIDKLVAGNAQFIRFLVLMDSAVTSERDIRARVEAAKQLLESDLIDEQQKVLLLNNKIKELKEKAETVAVENAELRAQMQAELEAIQVQLKERMLSMM
ncbi:MAG: hypothetical protein ACSW8C_02795 [bacterium]